MVPTTRTLLASIVDYAGLFPPAESGMQEAVREFARARSSQEGWMLGHFVLPAARLDEFENAAATLFSRASGDPWPLSLVSPEVTDVEVERIRPFNHRWRSRASVRAMEIAPLEPDKILRTAGRIPAGVDAYFEVRWDSDVECHLAAVAVSGASAKVRTGGTTAAAFPGALELCRFIFACAGAPVGFKATAGLHHPLRGRHGLAEMHGFFNLAVAAATVYQKRGSVDDVAELLESPGEAFEFRDSGVTWKDRTLTLSEPEMARHRFFRSFGSCSFQEPVDDLKELKLL